MIVEGYCNKHGSFDAHWHTQGKNPKCPTIGCVEKIKIFTDENNFEKENNVEDLDENT